MWVRPIREPALLEELAERVVQQFPGRARVIVDGAPPTRPAALADALVEALRLRGRPVLRVSAADFLRPASVRLEHGRTDPDALLHGWLDVAGLRREVLEPGGTDGSGQVLPRLWDSRVDRAYRAERVELATNGVLVLAGELLLGRGLPTELTVHLRLSAAALARRLDPQLHWTVPAYQRYDAEHNPTTADVVVLADNPHRLALMQR